jgi:hypothetical protein
MTPEARQHPDSLLLCIKAHLLCAYASVRKVDCKNTQVFLAESLFADTQFQHPLLCVTELGFVPLHDLRGLAIHSVRLLFTPMRLRKPFLGRGVDVFILKIETPLVVNALVSEGL